MLPNKPRLQQLARYSSLIQLHFVLSLVVEPARKPPHRSNKRIRFQLTVHKHASTAAFELEEVEQRHSHFTSKNHNHNHVIKNRFHHHISFTAPFFTFSLFSFFAFTPATVHTHRLVIAVSVIKKRTHLSCFCFFILLAVLLTEHRSRAHGLRAEPSDAPASSPRRSSATAV